MATRTVSFLDPSPSSATNDRNESGLIGALGTVGSSGADDATGKKRARDSRGIDKFKQIIYGEKGFQRLHAMAERSTVLMYPPKGVMEARHRYLLHQSRVDAALRAEMDRHAKEEDEIEVLDLVEKRRRLEEREEQQRQRSSSPLSSELNVEVANYHHKQLDCFLKMVYEFNHTTLLKLPMNDTLRMLSRCGREAAAHLTEFEMHARLKRTARLEELTALKKKETELQERQLAFEAAQEEMDIQLAEEHFRQTMESIPVDLLSPLGSPDEPPLRMSDTEKGQSLVDPLDSQDELIIV